MPERAPLKAPALSSFERHGHRVEKVLYESRPEFYIPANLYIPAATGGRSRPRDQPALSGRRTDVTRSVAPRRVTLAGLVNGAGAT